jgi:hypothetical protein
MAIETNEKRESHKGIYEVFALGLAGIAIVLLMGGVLDYQHGQEFLRMPQVLENPKAVVLAKEIIGRGLVEVGSGITALSGFTVAIIRRLRI